MRRALVSVCVWIVAAAMAATARAEVDHSVLIVFSDNRLLPTNVEVDDAFRKALASSRTDRFEVYSEFLDRAVFAGPAYDEALLNLFRQKYAGPRTPTVILAGGTYAVRFLLANRATLFQHVPIVFAGMSAEEVEKLQPLPPDVIGVPVSFDYRGTVLEALRLHPKTRRLWLIVGANPVDRNDLPRLRQIADEVRDRVDVEILDGLTIEALQSRLRTLGPNDLVFTSGFFSDGAGRQMIPREAAQIIASTSPAPVYGPFTTFIGTGIVGGRMPSWRTVGSDAAYLVSQIFDGTDPAHVDVPKATASTLQIDWRQARRFGITEEQLPPDANVLFREPTFWEAYGRYAVVAAVVMLLQAVLIALLLHERRLQRRTAAALDMSQRNLTLAAQTARLTTWIWDTNPVSDEGVVEPGAVAFDDVLSTVHPADREVLARAVHGVVGRGNELDIAYRVVNGEQVTWIAARGRADEAKRTRLRGVALDITARRNAELQAEQDRNALRHMTRVSLLGQLSASIAHELNQPLAAILGNAEAARTMLSRANVDQVELREICDDIIAQDNRAAAVIRRLGALFKGGDRIDAPLEINDLIVETLDLLRSDLMTRHVTITKALSPELPAVLGDRVQLQQVLMNLVVNACDAMNAIAADERTLRIRTDAVDREVRVTVSDRGPGISADNLERVFDAFWSTKAGGMGIGLAVCRSIATAHGGTLTATNNEAGGATFRLTLPIERAA